MLLDRYIAYRTAAGHPVSRREFADAARYTKAIGGYGPKVAESIAARARRHLEARPKTPSQLKIANEAQSALP